MAGERETEAASPSSETQPVDRAPGPALLPFAGLRSDLAGARPADVLRLQRRVGNRAVARAVTSTRRQMLSREPPPMAEHAGSATLTTITGQAFVAGPGEMSDVLASDVNQGQVGDCNLLAPLAAVARAKPSAIRRLIETNSDGSYNVTLYYKDHFWNDPTAHTINVTSQFYTDASGAPIYAKFGSAGAVHELWVMLIEKAFAKWKGGFDAAAGAMSDREGLELITGKPATESSVSSGSEDDLLNAISNALAAGDALTVRTCPRNYQNWLENAADRQRMDTYHIVKTHAYSIESVDTTAKTLNLRNPWGYQHLTGLPVSVFRQFPFTIWSRVSPP
jgi:hypothetical protein